MAALTCEALRSELEAFAEHALRDHLDRLESNLLQGIQHEIRASNSAGPMPPGPMQKRPPAPPWQGKPVTLALPHQLPPVDEDLDDDFRFIGKWAETVERDNPMHDTGGLPPVKSPRPHSHDWNSHDRNPHPAPVDEDLDFRYIGKWAETVERDNPMHDTGALPPHRSPRPGSKDRNPLPAQHRSQPPVGGNTLQVPENQAPKHEKKKVSKSKAPGPPPDDAESIEPLRTYVMASEMHEIDKAQEKPPNFKRAFASKRSVGGSTEKKKSVVPLTRSKTSKLSSKSEDQSKVEDESNTKLQAAGRASAEDRISLGSPKDAPLEAFAVQNEDEKGRVQVQRESELTNHNDYRLDKPSQMVVADEETNGHLDSQFSFEDDENFCSKCYHCIAAIVKNPLFDYTSALFIFANSFCIGLQTEWSAENYMNSIPNSYRIVDYCFCCVFTLELVLRLITFRMTFFFCADWKWNVFDTLLVGMQLTEEILNLFASKMQALNFSFMRVLRILRLVRIVRLFRVLRVITELRTIVSSIAGCMKSLFSTLVLLILMIYVVGVFFTQLVSDYYANRTEQDRVPDLDLYYGSLSRSILSLYQAMSGGLDWENMVNPLIDNISPALAVVFSFYVAFTVLAMMNVVTGVFVESALLSAKEDKDIYMVNHMRALLKSTDVDNSGTITWDEFQGQLSNPQMVELFRSIDVDIKEARGLFDLLDMNDLGKITTDQFVTGCLRLRGHAKSLDLSLLIHEQRRISKRTFSHIRYVESQLTYLCETIGYASDPGNPLLKSSPDIEV